MKSIFVLIVLISLNNYINCVEFQDCGSADGKVTSVSVSGCSASDAYCALISRSSTTMNIKFTSNVDSSSNRLKMWGIIGGVAIPFPPRQRDACKLGMSCPVTKGSGQEITFSVPVASFYPRISLYVRVAVVDEKRANLVCTQFPARIV